MALKQFYTFETTDIGDIPFDYSDGGDGAWSITTDKSYAGTKSLVSTAPAPGMAATAALLGLTCIPATLSFYYWLGGEPGVSKLEVWVDSTRKIRAFATDSPDWAFFTTSITAGVHDIEFQFYRGDHGGVEPNQVFIDNLTLPIVNTDPTSAEINVNGGAIAGGTGFNDIHLACLGGAVSGGAALWSTSAKITVNGGAVAGGTGFNDIHLACLGGAVSGGEALWSTIAMNAISINGAGGAVAGGTSPWSTLMLNAIYLIAVGGAVAGGKCRYGITEHPGTRLARTTIIKRFTLAKTTKHFTMTEV